MLAEPNNLRNSVKEPDHVMFPVPDMIANLLAEYGGSLVVRIEVHVEGINIACTMIVDNDGAAGRSLRPPSFVRLDTVKPGRISSDVVDGGQVNGIPSEGVERIEVVQS